FGQGALLIANPEALENPFYLAYPGWALYPMVALATAATIIASQATISGAYDDPAYVRADHGTNLRAGRGLAPAAGRRGRGRRLRQLDPAGSRLRRRS